MEPFIKILYSECDDPTFRAGNIMSLGDANSLFEQKDYMCAENKVVENIVYEISYTVNDEIRTYCCSQNLGGGEGSVINYLRKETIGALEALYSFSVPGSTTSSKNPFGVIRRACKNMLDFVLPELEAYCLAYRANEIISSFFVDNCNPRLQEGTDKLIGLVKSEPLEFIKMLEEVIVTNPDNTGMIFSVEGLIDKTERYMHFVSHKDEENDKLVDILKEASERATAINSKSIFYGIEPPLEKDEFDEWQHE